MTWGGFSLNFETVEEIKKSMIEKAKPSQLEPK